MPSFAVAEELRDFIRSNIDMTNVTNFTNRPIIILIDEKIASDDNPGVTGDPLSGILKLGTVLPLETYIEIPITGDFSDELFTIYAEYELPSQAAKTNFEEMLEELKNVMRVANAAKNTRAYYYKMEAKIFSYFPLGIAEITYQLKRELVAV